MAFIVYHRPFADNSLIENDYYPVCRIPDWNIVFQELEKFQTLKLQAMIQNTSCQYDIKISLYNSVITGDSRNFAKVIQENEREACGLISTAYATNFYRIMLDDLYDQFNNPPKEVTKPLDIIDKYQGKALINNPFTDININEHLLFFNADSDLAEYYLSRFDMFVKLYNNAKEYANPLEIKVLNRLSNYIDDHPELKEAYERYKTKEETPSYTEDESPRKKTPDNNFVDLEIFKTEIGYANYNSRELLPPLNSFITKRGDNVFKEFINFLAYSNCIDDDSATKQLLVYRFTGKCRPKGDLGKIPWNPDKLKELAFVIMYSTANISGKYNKVRDFFEGPNFPDDMSSIRTIANSASKEFRSKLNDFYPEVFRLKI